MPKVVKRMTSDFNQANSPDLLYEVLLKNPNAATPVWANLQQLKSILGGGGESSSLISLKTFTKYTIINGTLIEI